MTALLLLAVVVLVLLNGFFVAAEFALVRARKATLEAQGEEGRGSAATAAAMMDDLSRYLSACQLGITLTSLGIGFLGEPAVASLIEPLFEEGLPSGLALGISIALAYLITTSLHITIGEQVPKIYAIQKAEPVSRLIARPLHGLRHGVPPVHRGTERRLQRDPPGAGRPHRRRAGRRRVARGAAAAHPAGDDRRHASIPARPGCSPASSTCTSRRRARS